MNPLNFYKSRPKFSLTILAIFIVAFSLAGLYFIFRSEATMGVLPKPTQNEPTDGSILNVKRPQLKWSTVVGANAYQIRLYQDDTLLRDDIVTTNSYTPDFDMADKGNYYWQVRAVNRTSQVVSSKNRAFAASKRKNPPKQSPSTPEPTPTPAPAPTPEPTPTPTPAPEPSYTIISASPYTRYWNLSIDLYRNNNHIMPNPSGVWAGAYVPGTATDFASLENVSARKHQVAVKFRSFYWDSSFPAAEAKGYYDLGTNYVVTWEPWNPGAGSSQSQFSNTAITNNQAFTTSSGASINFDTYVNNWASQIKSYKKPVYIRFAHEMNGNWYPWGAVSGNSPANYVAMWRKVHSIFDAKGVKNVYWVWCANADPQNTIPGYYPGDEYVDIVSIDGYNWGNTKSWSSWMDLKNIIGGPYNIISGLTQKDIWITETASTESGGNKSLWITNAYNIRTLYPRIKTIIWFNANKETDWRVNSSTSSLDAYKKALFSF